MAKVRVYVKVHPKFWNTFSGSHLRITRYYRAQRSASLIPSCGLLEDIWLAIETSRTVLGGVGSLIQKIPSHGDDTTTRDCDQKWEPGLLNWDNWSKFGPGTPLTIKQSPFSKSCPFSLLISSISPSLRHSDQNSRQNEPLISYNGQIKFAALHSTSNLIPSRHFLLTLLTKLVSAAGSPRQCKELFSWELATNAEPIKVHSIMPWVALFWSAPNTWLPLPTSLSICVRFCCTFFMMLQSII